MPAFKHAGLKVVVVSDSVSVRADSAALYAWAHRSGHIWPCSALARMNHLRADFDSNGLFDIEGETEDSELMGDELSAFTSDAISAVLPTDHPCYIVTVGQYNDG